jgi:hypothetical protein
MRVMAALAKVKIGFGLRVAERVEVRGLNPA